MTDLEAVKIGLGQFQDQMTESLEQITTDLIKLRRADDLKTERTPVTIFIPRDRTNLIYSL